MGFEHGRLFAQAAVTEKALGLLEQAKKAAVEYAVPIGGKIVGAIVLWVVGRIVIGVIRRGFGAAFERRKIDGTLVRYLDSVMGVVLNLLLVIAILSLFGVETTSFAGILAAAGVAIGMAWSGLLSNFAAGVFMIILQPFKVGDYVVAGGVEGTVKEIGLFATSIDTPDNVRTFVGNAKIFGDTVRNFSTNPYRRVDIKAQLAHSVDPHDAIKRLRARLSTIKNVVKEPAPSVEILEFTSAGPVLAVRPSCHNSHYWDVYFATNEAIVKEFTDAGYPVPAENRLIRQQAA
ncbi:MAG: mechanosensitive ion channel family protein [Polyangiaceae bacterium]|nr:mechanosensitive ion channel family protein [Polyangiaceae bacterium]